MRQALVYIACCLVAGIGLTWGLVEAQRRADVVAIQRASADGRLADADRNRAVLATTTARVAELARTVAALQAQMAQQTAEYQEHARRNVVVMEQANDTVKLQRVLAHCAGVTR